MTHTEAPETYVSAILATYQRASAADIAAGRDWYPRAQHIVNEIAQFSGARADRVAAAMAALSPRNPWQWNVQDCAAYAYASTHGDNRPIATTFGDNQARAWAFLHGDADWSTSALKVRSFVANILGDTGAVTVDVWAVRIATNGERVDVRSDADYHALEDAYRAAATIAGETPRDMQAITWLVGQRDGMGSARRGRHDRSLKRGTIPLVALLLTGQLSWLA